MRGILFQPDMVRKILAKKKRQTRRIIKPQPPTQVLSAQKFTWTELSNGHWMWSAGGGQGVVKCPYGQPGEVLAVREAWRTEKEYNYLKPTQLPIFHTVHFEADGAPPPGFGRYRHARFMLTYRSRIQLGLTSVRIERLRDITEEDARAEGVAPSITSPGFECRAAFQTLWVRINGQASWDANPYVWVLGWD